MRSRIYGKPKVNGSSLEVSIGVLENSENRPYILSAAGVYEYA